MKFRLRGIYLDRSRATDVPAQTDVVLISPSGKTAARNGAVGDAAATRPQRPRERVRRRSSRTFANDGHSRIPRGSTLAVARVQCARSPKAFAMQMVFSTTAPWKTARKSSARAASTRSAAPPRDRPRRVREERSQRRYAVEAFFSASMSSETPSEELMV